MLPIILGVVGAGFLVSAYSEKKEKKFAKGGRLELGKIGKLKDSIPTNDKKSMVEIYEYEDKYIVAVRRDGWEANFIEKVYPTYEAAYKAAGAKANSFAKGGEVKDSLVKAIFYSNQKVRKGGINKINTDFGEKTYTGLESMILNEAYSPSEIAEAIFSSNAKRGLIETGYGKKNVQGLTEMIEDARSKEYAKGGSIPNNYKGKTAEQVWDKWSLEQKRHFILDHISPFYKIYKNSEINDICKLSGKEIIDTEYDKIIVDDLSFGILKIALERHISEGQYAKGGEVKDDYLLLTFKVKKYYDDAKKHFDPNEGSSNFYPDKHNDEFKTFYFEVKSQDDADNLERFLTQELDELGLSEYYFENETKFAKGGNVNTGRSWHLDRAKHNKNEKWENPIDKRKKKYAKGGNVYSSEEPYIVKVYSHSNELLDQKTIRAKNNKEANEMAEDMEDGFKKKFGNDLRIKVVEAQKMAKGGKVAKADKPKRKPNAQSGKMKDVIAHAKATRKDGEAWKSAVARAWKEVK